MCILSASKVSYFDLKGGIARGTEQDSAPKQRKHSGKVFYGFSSFLLLRVETVALLFVGVAESTKLRVLGVHNMARALLYIGTKCSRHKATEATTASCLKIQLYIEQCVCVFYDTPR